MSGGIWRGGIAGLVALAGLAVLVLGPIGLAVGLRDRTEAGPPRTGNLLGTEVRDGPVRFVVHAIHCGLTPDAFNGQLCEVTIEARNEGAAAVTVPGPAQLLYGSDGVRFLPAIDTERAPFGSLAPGEAATAAIRFDLPYTAVATVVEVHAGPYTPGRLVAIGGPPMPLLSAMD